MRKGDVPGYLNEAKAQYCYSKTRFPRIDKIKEMIEQGMLKVISNYSTSEPRAPKGWIFIMLEGVGGGARFFVLLDLQKVGQQSGTV